MRAPARGDPPGVTVYATAPDETVARRLARLAVERRLAACVNVVPIASTYRWRGEVVEEREFAVLIKTTRERSATVFALVAEVTQQEIPCAVAWPWIDALPAYADWVRVETK
ncbi:MAG: divalent-cation tolerance protein CutA [Thermoplasmatota archaeon]